MSWQDCRERCDCFRKSKPSITIANLRETSSSNFYYNIKDFWLGLILCSHFHPSDWWLSNKMEFLLQMIFFLKSPQRENQSELVWLELTCWFDYTGLTLPAQLLFWCSSPPSGWKYLDWLALISIKIRGWEVKILSEQDTTGLMVSSEAPGWQRHQPVVTSVTPSGLHSHTVWWSAHCLHRKYLEENYQIIP